MRARGEVRLPAPGVHFGADFLPRLGRLRLALIAGRERREGAGKARLLGAGAEFTGYRPYRPGENPRALDWHLYARLRRPFVRVARREASESWAVLVDTSASMGVGDVGSTSGSVAPRGKLQLAAEVATALCALGLAEGASVELVLSSPASERLVVRRAHGLMDWMRRFEAQEAGGSAGLATLVAEPARVRNAGSVFLLGDFLDLEPRDALSLSRRGRQLYCAQILAPSELAAPSGDAVHWRDAESLRHRTVVLDRRTRGEYERRVGERLEALRTACARHRAVHGVWSANAAFEDVVNELFA